MSAVALNSRLVSSSPNKGEGIRTSSLLSDSLLSDKLTPMALALAYASRNAWSGV